MTSADFGGQLVSYQLTTSSRHGLAFARELCKNVGSWFRRKCEIPYVEGQHRDIFDCSTACVSTRRRSAAEAVRRSSAENSDRATGGRWLGVCREAERKNKSVRALTYGESASELWLVVFVME